jgi:AAA family ATP:ADP antiporter
MKLLSIKKNEWLVFGLMFLIVCLINVNFSVLRSMRNALVVAGEGGSSAFIPYFELFGTFPASILLTWGLSRLMRFFSFRFIFSTMMLGFLAFFVIFAFWIYPQKEQIQTLIEAKLGLLFGLDRFKVIFTRWPDMVFYIMSELWKVALLSVIFWGFINQNLSLDKAKRFYPSLMLGSSIGAILAGPVTVFCTSQFSWTNFSLSSLHWQHSLNLLTIFLVTCGLVTLFAFRYLFSRLDGNDFVNATSEKKEKKNFSKHLLSLRSSLSFLIRSPYLSAILLIVVAEYISYALGELIFLNTLKQSFPTRSGYCQYMGTLSLWTGVLTAFSALILTPFCLQKFRWSTCAFITPILMVIMTFAFFFIIYLGRLGTIPTSSYLALATAFGSMHFCFGRSIKYTFFDATKELAFVPLDQEAQVKGKLIIDGIGSRLGRGSSSLLSIVLFFLMGGVGESAIFAGIIALGFAIISLPAAKYLGIEFEKKAPTTAKA